MKTRLAMIVKKNWLRWVFFWISFPRPESTFASSQVMLETRRRILKKVAARLREERRAVCENQIALPVTSFDPAI